MDDLVAWLGKQLDEDQRIAEGAGGRRGQWRLARPLDDEEMGDASFLRPPELRHAERHDPARVLREVDAKRRILATLHEEGGDRMFADIFRLLALPYADRPGYLESWRP
ncbi:DUF6221 family protein [Streptomyces sp. NPDC005885]|uniref:DUF6221 family protein n=1 Tax=Streptomyces sp. NPDC005885 TaxID=3157079 RepID=UPI0033F73CB9